ncbi:hypothetical protein K502DRAFT_347921 [Neoconidiobolus thromboides FSU 785]|nr:hypothetical protein K502DRAFT_347921 [Neoconidiobolus thromboides FSU 785]
MNQTEIESQEVIQLIQQYLKENNLTKSYEALKEETGNSLNLVKDINLFQSQIENGEWDLVLEQTQNLDLKPKVLIELYEQIFLELLEMKEVTGARELLRHSEPLSLLRNIDAEKYLNLENLISRTFLDLREFYPNNNEKIKRRQQIGKKLSTHLITAPPARLLTLLNQSIKYQQSQGLLLTDTDYDLFQGKNKKKEEDIEEMANKFYCSIKLPKKTHAESVLFSNDGISVVTGSTDGFIEVWNINTGKLRKDLKYQFEKNPMFMSSSILSMSLSSNNELIASGCKEGNLHIYNLINGRLVKKYLSAHENGITCISFILDNTKVLTAGFDQTIRVFGLNSGKKIKQFTGHTSFVNGCVMNFDNTKVLSVGSEGVIRIWDYKTSECLKIITSDKLGFNQAGFNNNLGGITLFKILKVQMKLNEEAYYLIGSNSNCCHLIDFNGNIIRKYELSNEDKKIVDISISSQFQFIYLLDMDGIIYCLDFKNGNLLHQFQVII